MLELHLPYIRHAGEQPFQLVPIMVGALEEAEAMYGRLLAPYLADPQNLFCDLVGLCHWGDRFNFTYHDRRHGGEIYQSIEALGMGMDLIERMDPFGFAQYQREYANTICGRHPISVLLHCLTACAASDDAATATKHKLQFVRYAQSSRCRRPATRACRTPAPSWVALRLTAHGTPRATARLPSGEDIVYRST